MPFPEIERVIYQKLPLEEVICQIRFPPILTIDTEIPSVFQEAIRQEYPFFKETTNIINIDIPNNLKELFPKELTELPPRSEKNFEFLSKDRMSKINLTRDFLAISTRRYSRWESFRECILRPFEVFNRIYSPVIFIRIGLRYRNVIARSKLNLDGIPWNELIKPCILGILSETTIKTLNTIQTSEIQMADGKSVIRINNGLIEQVNNNEMCYVIDNDFFLQDQIEPTDVFPMFDYFNLRSGRLFRWCITDRLHRAMEPEKI